MCVSRMRDARSVRASGRNHAPVHCHPDSWWRTIMRKCIGAFVLLAAALAASCACADDLRIGVRTEASSMDPHFSSSVVNIEMALHIFEPLIRFDGQMKLVPTLATSWKAIDDKTWEFKLRQGVKFHDGSPFTADD